MTMLNTAVRHVLDARRAVTLDELRRAAGVSIRAQAKLADQLKADARVVHHGGNRFAPNYTANTTRTAPEIAPTYWQVTAECSDGPSVTRTVMLRGADDTRAHLFAWALAKRLRRVAFATLVYPATLTQWLDANADARTARRPRYSETTAAMIGRALNREDDKRWAESAAFYFRAAGLDTAAGFHVPGLWESGRENAARAFAESDVGVPSIWEDLASAAEFAAGVQNGGGAAEWTIAADAWRNARVASIGHSRRQRYADAESAARANAAPEYRLASAAMVHTPGIVRWAINGAKFKKDRAKMARVIADGWSIPYSAAFALVTESVPYTVEGETVVFRA